MKLTHRLLCLVLAAVTLFALSACGAQFDKESDDIKEDFLIKAYTSDYKGRYTTLEALSQITQSDADRFYSCIKGLCSRDVYRQLADEYTLIIYDRYAHESGLELTPVDFAFEPIESDGKGESFVFLMTMHVCPTEEDVYVAGTITVSGGKVTQLAITSGL